MATCFLNNVYCCYLPAHCSHGLQPLDNGVFNASKAAYRRELEKFASLTDSAPMDKVNFIRACAKARRVGMTKKNILSGWRVTGNWPISRAKALRHPEIQQNRPNGSPRVTPEPRLYLGQGGESIYQYRRNVDVDRCRSTSIYLPGGHVGHLSIYLTVGYVGEM
jgi:hypothetical protein